MNTDTPPALEGAFAEPFVPYVRSTRKTRFGAKRDRERLAQYEASKARIAALVRQSMSRLDFYRRRIFEAPVFPTAYRVGLVVLVPTVIKSGELPAGGRGDHDNYTKAFIDALVGDGVFGEDSPRWYHGPCDINGQPSGIYAAPARELVAFWRIEASTKRTFNPPPNVVVYRDNPLAAAFLKTNSKRR